MHSGEINASFSKRAELICLLARYLVAVSLMLPRKEEGMALTAKERLRIEGDRSLNKDQAAKIRATARARTRIIAWGLARIQSVVSNLAM